MEGLLERDSELETLANVVEDAAGGRGAIVLIAGEAGIGKTSLVRALRGRVGERVTFLIGACEPLSVPVPLGPLREIFELAGGGDLIERGADDRLVLVRRLLGALVERAPALAVIEDLHWADPTTLDVIRLLARRIEESGVALLITYRADEVAANTELGLLLGDLATSPAVRRLTLRPLTDAAVRALAGPSGLDATQIARVTAGNPFLVVETIVAGGRLPASVRDAALARAGRLGAAARAVVDAAAVIGQRFEPRLLESLVPDSATAVEEALARGVLVHDSAVLGFRHELIREAIESAISPPRLAALHRSVFTALAQQVGSADNARLAHHAELGGLVAEACRCAALAAGEAERVGALREMQLQADRALRLGSDLDPATRLELLLQYSRAANFSSIRLEDAVSAAEQAVALADRLRDPLGQGRALGTLAWALWSQDRVVEANAMAERAIAVLEPCGDTAALARAHSTHIRMQATAFDPTLAIETAPRALELAAGAELEEVQIDIAISVALARGHRGEREGLALLEQALAAARRAGLTIQTVRAYVNVICVASMLREHELLDRTARVALELFDQYDTPIPARAIQSYVARSLLDRGRWEEAHASAAQSMRIWHGEVPVARAIQALIDVRRGEPAGDQVLEQSWTELTDTAAAEASRHGMIRLALVEAAWLRGDHRAALAQLQAAGEAVETARFPRSAGELALWASRYRIDLGQPDRASVPVELELAGDWRGAIQAWHQLDAPYEAALAALPGDDQAAREALAALQGLGATAAARAFARERSAAGAPALRGPRRSTLANAAGLTRREQEVLAQLATGATNAVIAASLHLSERTVAHHVSAILAKLGATNRVSAIEQARSRGLLPKDGPLSRTR